MNRDRNTNIDIDEHHGGHWDDEGAYFGVGLVTGLAVGTMVTSLPPSCTPTVVNGTTYQSCNGVLYQPVYSGTSVQYEVVSP
ncbi:MAG TPA: DUF6515 family protein [Armatimonadota bacterium]|nr:DUF6515 family protein [Armatimonadota bacterium]